jgi:hypothetical protein
MDLKRIASSLSQPLSDRRDYGSSSEPEQDDEPTGEAHWDIPLGMLGTYRAVLEHGRILVFTKKKQLGPMNEEIWTWVQASRPPWEEISLHLAKLLSGGA